LINACDVFNITMTDCLHRKGLISADTAGNAIIHFFL